MPEEQRSNSPWVFLTASYARPGRTGEAADAKAKPLKAFPNVSAERMINEDYVYARQEDNDFFVEASDRGPSGLPDERGDRAICGA